MTSTGTGSRRARPNDPDRRDRIARAAISVVAAGGVESLTHRAVAAEAAVPLGSTTYHFATLDDLLSVALRHAVDESIDSMRRWRSGLAPGADVADVTAALIVGSLGERRAHTVVEYDLYVAALRRPRLRSIGAAWDSALADVFGSLTDPVTGRMLAALYCGLLMQAAIVEPGFTEAEIRDLLRRAVAGSGQGSGETPGA